MELFHGQNVNMDALKKKAFNFRWAEVGEGVIPLTAADPDFPAAREVSQAIIDYLQDGYLSYTPKLGFPSFREAIAKDLRERKDEPVSADLVLPIDSAARGMYLAAAAVLKEGDEAIVFDPVDYLFKNACMAAGATPVYFPTVVKDGEIDFSDLESYITPKTKMFCLCNPHNPLGKVYSKQTLDHILTLCEKYGIWIMNDEIWSDITYGERPFVSINSLGAERNKKTISIYGFSKAYGVAGLRAGCIYCMDEAVFEKIVDVSGVMTTAGGIASLSQIGAEACITKARYWTVAFLQHLKANRDYAYSRLCKMEGIVPNIPEATYLFWIDVTQTGLSSSEFCDYMMEHAKLALVPGSEKMFGPGAEGYVRLCFATSREILTEGLDRLEAGLKKLRGEA